MLIKPIVHHTFLLFSFVLSAFIGSGQAIDEIQIIPEDPISTEDVVSVIATAWHPTQGCPIVNTEFAYNQDTITVIVEHELGLATAICNSIDTTALGTYAPGTYKVEYIMISGVFGETPVADTAYTEFTVEGVNALTDQDSNSSLKIYPNPCSEFVLIETEWRGLLTVYDVFGKRVDQFRINNSPERFSLDGLSRGVYFLVPAEDNDFKGVKLIVN